MTTPDTNSAPLSSDEGTRMCHNCWHWDADEGAKHGLCRAAPPTIFFGNPDGYWPRTKAYDFCGACAPMNQITAENETTIAG